jgi:hypothetical protein
MKRYGSNKHDATKRKDQEWKREHAAGGFRCAHCKRFVVINGIMGTVNRNHCNMCLWSKHVDVEKGDRQSQCNAGMEPIGLTFKHEGMNRVGEIMLIHACTHCSRISINRIARDDLESMVLEIFTVSQDMSIEQKLRISQQDIYMLAAVDTDEVTRQLFGG